MRLERGGIGAGKFEAEFGQMLAEFGAADLHHRGLEARRAAASELGHHLQFGGFECLRFGFGLRELAGEVCVEEAFLGGDLAEAAQAREQAGAIGRAAALELEQVLRDRPALIDLADDIGLRHAHVGEEDGVLDMLAGQHQDGIDAHAGGGHVDQDECDALLLLAGRIRPYKAEHHVGFVGVRRPDLGAVADVVVAIFDGGHGEGGEVRSGVRL